MLRIYFFSSQSLSFRQAQRSDEQAQRSGGQAQCSDEQAQRFSKQHLRNLRYLRETNSNQLLSNSA